MTAIRIGIGLARVSTEGQAKNDSSSLEGQALRIEEYAKSHGISLIAVEKEVYSGLSINRPTIDKLKSLIIEYKVSDLVVYSPDRYTRNIIFGMLFDEWLSAHNVTLHYTTRGQVDTSSPSGRLHTNIERSFSSYEADVIRDRSMKGKREYLAKGIPGSQGKAKYGYVHIGKKAHSRLEIVEHEAIVIRRIYTLYLELQNVYDVARKLEAENIYTRNNRKWSTGMIYQALRDELYAGVYTALRYQIVNGKQIQKDKQEWIRISIPAIIERGTWDTVQKSLNDGRRKPRKAKRVYLLRGLVYCVCGKTATPTTSKSDNKNGKEHHYYRCNAMYKTQQLQPCDKACTISGEKLDAAVWQWIVETLDNPNNRLHALEKFKQEQSKVHLSQQEEKIYAAKLLQEYEEELDIQTLTYPKAKGEFAIKILNRCNELSDKIADLRKILAGQDTTMEQETIDDIRVHIQEVSNVYQGINSSLEIKVHVVNALEIKVILIDKSTIQINWFWGVWQCQII